MRVCLCVCVRVRARARVCLCVCACARATDYSMGLGVAFHETETLNDGLINKTFCSRCVCSGGSGWGWHLYYLSVVELCGLLPLPEGSVCRGRGGGGREEESILSKDPYLCTVNRELVQTA